MRTIHLLLSWPSVRDFLRSLLLLLLLPLLLLLLLLLSLPAAAQQQLSVKHGCAYKTAAEDATLYTFEPSDEARRIVGEICNAVGVSQNFDLRASSVDNALATTDGNRRIILYSTVFLKKFNEAARTRWAAYSVLAHEIGHHFNGHNFAEADPVQRKKWELEADRFSGSSLRLLGATLDEANAGIETFALDAEQKYHPPPRARREAIATGWTQQQERLEKIGAGGNTNPATGLPRERDSDADGIPDKDDACPQEYGRALTAGCPDADEDGVTDRDDACRYLKGPAQWKGCPDTDGDGLPDHEDQCPDKAGYLADKGCPPPDRDSDAVPDRADKCPDTWGLPRYQGCPDTDGDGVPDPDDKCPNEKGDTFYEGCMNNTATGVASTPPLAQKGAAGDNKVKKKDRTILDPPEYKEHIVRAGETMTSIAVKFKMNVQELASLNNIAVDEKLIVGRRIIVRQLTTEEASGLDSKVPIKGETIAEPKALPPTQEYIVRQGETMNSIAIKFKMNVQELAGLNGIATDELLTPGRRLVVRRY